LQNFCLADRVRDRRLNTNDAVSDAMQESGVKMTIRWLGRLKTWLMIAALVSLTLLEMRIGPRLGETLSTSYFAAVCKEFGGAQRLGILVDLIQQQPAGPGLDARVALELGWLQPYSEWKLGDRLVTGVTTGDFGETYLLYAPWFRYSPRNWWDNGAAICNRVPNIPRYTSDPNAALPMVAGVHGQGYSVAICKTRGLWTVRVFGGDEEDVLGVCDDGMDTMAKALIVAAIDHRLRRLG
jgi:hypothetical protein